MDLTHNFERHDDGAEVDYAVEHIGDGQRDKSNVCRHFHAIHAKFVKRHVAVASEAKRIVQTDGNSSRTKITFIPGLSCPDVVLRQFYCRRPS